MKRPTSTGVYITGTATCMPNAPVDNAHMEQVLGQVGPRPSRARAIVLRNNGIKRRFYALDPVTGLPTHSNAQLTAQAVRNLCDAEFSLDQLDCLATGTSMPDQLMPNHGVMVHGELGTTSHEVASTAGICLAGVTALRYAYLSVLSGERSCAVSTGSEIASVGLAIPQERWFTNLGSMGNTGSAAFYIMLDELLRSKRLQPGQKLLAFVPESGRFSSGFIHMTAIQGEEDKNA